MDYAAESLKLHKEWKGKIEVVCRAPLNTRDDLSLAYTPGVAEPCLAIQKDVNLSYDLTRRSNLVAVVTDGTAVLGLGDIGPGGRHARYGGQMRPVQGLWQTWTRFRCACGPRVWTIL